MIKAGLVDFAFTGAAILPSVLMFNGYPAQALLILVPMLIGACLLGAGHQHCGDASAESPPETGREAGQGAGQRRSMREV